MVPYVRKSFFKHYKDGLKYICNYTQEDLDRELTFSKGVASKDISICDNDTYCYPEAYNYAIDMTEREVY